MQVVGIYQVYEKDVGWLHELAVLTDTGTLVIIEDDTNDVTISSNDPNFDPKEAAKIWDSYAMGASHFPALPVPRDLPRPDTNKAPHVIWSGNSADDDFGA